MSKWELFKNWLSSCWLGKAWRWVVGFINKISNGISLTAILFLVWYGFLTLVEDPPLDTTPVLIMVWGTAGILILALFPSIINYINKVKIGDIEVELRDIVEKSITLEYITAEDLSDTPLPAEKGDTDNLGKIITKILQEPNKPVLLTVNLGRGGRISMPFLFVYLFLISAFSELTIVVFVNKRVGRQGIRSLKKENIIGVISCNQLLLSYYQRFPTLIATQANFQIRRNETYERIGLYQVPSRHLIHSYYDIVRQTMMNEYQNNRQLHDVNDWERLTETKIINWLGSKVEFATIDISLTPKDTENIRQSLYDEKEYILVTKDSELQNFIPIDTLNRKFTRRILDHLKDQT